MESLYLYMGFLDQGYFHDGLYLPHQMNEYEKIF